MSCIDLQLVAHPLAVQPWEVHDEILQLSVATHLVLKRRPSAPHEVQVVDLLEEKLSAGQQVLHKASDEARLCRSLHRFNASICCWAGAKVAIQRKLRIFHRPRWRRWQRSRLHRARHRLSHRSRRLHKSDSGRQHSSPRRDRGGREGLPDLVLAGANEVPRILPHILRHFLLIIILLSLLLMLIVSPDIMADIGRVDHRTLQGLRCQGRPRRCKQRRNWRHLRQRKHRRRNSVEGGASLHGPEQGPGTDAVVAGGVAKRPRQGQQQPRRRTNQARRCRRYLLGIAERASAKDPHRSVKIRAWRHESHSSGQLLRIGSVCSRT
mmetsp:Transcript_72814/g.236542  ORF Transcript_72814/g.236542 Transcript_72814/m.236542 type:complete len:323 (-) Transcript_72814:944-1912(-)